MDLDTKVNKLAKETVALRNDMTNLKETLMQQTETIKNMLIEQNKIFEGTYQMEAITPCYYSDRFPIATQDDLDKLEADINNANINKLITLVRRIVTPGGLEKNTNRIFSMALVLDYNLYGKGSKKRLQDYPKIMSLLYRATCRKNWTHKQFLEDLRKGFSRVKNNHFSNVSIKRKREKLLMENSTPMLNMDESREYNCFYNRCKK